MQGQVNAQCATGSGEAFTGCFQFAAVTRPLSSIGKICDKCYRSIFDHTKAKIRDKKGVAVCLLQRAGLRYLGTMQLRNSHFEIFLRPSA